MLYLHYGALLRDLVAAVRACGALELSPLSFVWADVLSGHHSVSVIFNNLIKPIRLIRSTSVTVPPLL